MRRLLSAAVLLLFAALQAAMAAEPTLTVTRGTQSESYTLSDLLKHPAVTNVSTDASDEAYKRPMRYVAIPIETLVGALRDDEEVQFVALDGYAPVIDAKRLREIGAARLILQSSRGRGLAAAWRWQAFRRTVLLGLEQC